MSRLEEVENCIRWAESIELDMARIARTLANEVDELRAKLDQVRSEIGCARGQRTTQFCAEAVELQRRLDAIVKMLEPGKCSCNCVGELGPKCECSNIGNMRDVEAWWTTYCLHARALAIAEGRDNE